MTCRLTADSASMDKRVMAGWRQAIELAVNDVEVAALEETSRSRSEPAIRVTSRVVPRRQASSRASQASMRPGNSTSPNASPSREPYVMREHW
jgi:hypothetical protein